MVDDIAEILSNKKVMEAASRKLCAIRGENPDQTMYVPASLGENGFVPDTCMLEPRWYRAAQEITTMLQIFDAVGYAVEEADKDEIESLNN